jgi:hypothetical protein
MSRFGHRSRVTVLHVSLLMAGALCASSAEAIPLCVSTVPELKAALIYGLIQSTPYSIKVVQGTYVMDQDLSHTFNQPTTIEGGYTSGCAGRIVNSANTTIDMDGHGLFLTQPAGSPTAALSIDAMTIKNLADLWLTSGTWNYIGADDPGSLRLSRMRLASDSASTAPFYLWQQGGAGTTLENVVLERLSAPPASGCALEFEANNDTTRVKFIGVTANLSQGGDLCFGDDGDEAQVDIYNSVIWSSDGTHTSIRTQDVDHVVNLRNTIYRFKSGPGQFSEMGSSQSDPSWANPNVGDYHLTNNASPAVDSGTPIVPSGLPATDIEGNARWVGAAPDRGAYELKTSNAASYVVTTTADTNGAGTLRTAITQANANPNHTIITFAIPGACPQVIGLTSMLPRITSPIVIDGTTQPGSTKNSDNVAFNANVCVVVKPVSGMLALGLSVDPGATQASLVLRGVALGGFNQPVRLLGGSNHVIAGNRFGGFVGGYLAGATFNAITMGVDAAGSVIIGGANPADRNVIGSAALSGINVQGEMESTPDQCQIVNNLIGLSPSGNTAAPNFTGITLGGSGCSVRNNRVAGNTRDAIWVNGGSDHVIQSNFLGTAVNGSGFGTTGHGVRINGHYNTVGAADGGVVGGNSIRSMVKGVSVDSGSNNAIRANVIYQNAGLSIDLGNDGLTANDVHDSDAGPNNLQNSPQMTSLYFNSGSATKMTAVAQLDAASGTHRIDAYFASKCVGGVVDAPAHGGTQVVYAGAVFTVPLTLPAGYSFVALTSTDPYGNTSEFGNCLAVADAGSGPPPQSIIVSSTPPNPGIVGKVYTLAAKATSNLPLTLSVAPASSSVCKISGWNVIFTGPGACNIHINQAGDATFAPAPQVIHSMTVAAASLPAQTITFTSAPPNPALVGFSYTPMATASSGLPVSFAVDPSSAGSCFIGGGVVAFVGTQSPCIIHATQAGDATHAPAKPVKQEFPVLDPAVFIFKDGFEAPSSAT